MGGMGGTGGSRALSGQLYKYTNVVKGWQARWFSLDAERGVLAYYLHEGPRAPPPPAPPRGEAHLAAAVVCPSDEDSRTFSLNCASGDMLKLRASDARARQEWVDALRAVAQAHTKSGCGLGSAREALAAQDAVAAARAQLHTTELSDASLARSIESAESPFCHTDPLLLLLKATSAASVQVLLQCAGVLLHEPAHDPHPHPHPRPRD